VLPFIVCKETGGTDSAFNFHFAKKGDESSFLFKRLHRQHNTVSGNMTHMTIKLCITRKSNNEM
jgi:hypothetical protein